MGRASPSIQYKYAGSDMTSEINQHKNTVWCWFIYLKNNRMAAQQQTQAPLHSGA